MEGRGSGCRELKNRKPAAYRKLFFAFRIKFRDDAFCIDSFRTA